MTGNLVRFVQLGVLEEGIRKTKTKLWLIFTSFFGRRGRLCVSSLQRQWLPNEVIKILEPLSRGITY